MVNNEPKWRLVERVVKLIEQAITPNARIEHNVMMPDLTEASRSRQCDIVIWSGKPPRETITIVEVQDRNQPFDITTFDGMCAKMRKVGAQHLICVSRLNFPDSIKNEAKRQGPTVRLVLLKDLESGDWPVNIVDSCVYLFERRILAIEDLRLGVKQGQIPIDPRASQAISNQKIFRLEDLQGFYSIADLINLYIDKFETDFTSEGIRTIYVHFPLTDRTIWWEDFGNKIELIALDINAEVQVERIKVPIHLSSYHQSDYESALAWIMDATMTYRDKEISFQITLIPTEDGNYCAKVWNLPETMNVDFIQI